VSATHSDGAGQRAGALATSPARIALALLVLATFAALLLAQHLKDEAPLVGSAAWKPVGVFDPRSGDATLSFRTPYADRITVSIVSAQTGKVVAVLAHNLPEHGYTRQTFPWDGRTASGAAAPSGYYEVAVHFARLNRTPLVPSLRVDLKARA
jgi:hypothetical protein